MRYLTREPIDLPALIGRVEDEASGALAVFVGKVRNHDGGREILALEYECYPEMAEKVEQQVRSSIASGVASGVAEKTKPEEGEDDGDEPDDE